MNFLQQQTMKYISIILSDDTIKKTISTKNNIEQILHYYNYNLNNFGDYIEKPLYNTCKKPYDNSNKNELSIMVYNLSTMDFQKFIKEFSNTKNYISNIINILKKMFFVNDILYELCQFQHCDMKCMQVLLNIKEKGDDEILTEKKLDKKKSNKNLELDIVPILSDFDKSTLTLRDGEKY